MQPGLSCAARMGVGGELGRAGIAQGRAQGVTEGVAGSRLFARLYCS